MNIASQASRITDFSGDSVHTTFIYADGSTFKVRSFECHEALWAGPLTASALASILTFGPNGADNFPIYLGITIIVCGVVLYALLYGRFLWKELLIAGAVVELYLPGNAYAGLSLVATLIALVAYAVQWRTRALWEPVTSFVVLGATIAMTKTVPATEPWAPYLFVPAISFGFVGAIRVASDAVSYQQRCDELECEEF